MKQKPLKQYILRKYVQARSITEALRKEKETPVEDIWLDEKFVPPSTTVGFKK